MARKRTRSVPALSFDALTVEGALISPAMLARIAAHQADGQAEADYGVPKGLTLRDEIARYFRIGQALFASLGASETPSQAATIKFVEEFLRIVLGFADLKRVGLRTLGDRQFAVTLEGLVGRVPVVVVPPSDELDRPSDHLPTDGRRHSAASAIQDWLNANEESLWGLCCNGFRLRLVRDNESLTRPAFIEADLRAIFEEESFADFTALWLLVHASRFGPPDALPSNCALERWREAGQKEGVAARDRLRDGVEAALLSFGNGFLAHPDNGPLREKLHSGDLSLTDFFGQLLRLVYRLIFLLAAEDRDLLHPPGTSAAARKLYAQGYSLASLREAAVRRAAWDRHHDRWEGLKITFAALMRGEKRLGLPALDGLFAPGTLPDLENTKLANRALMEAVFRLAWLKDDSGLVPVNWRDMETEELGSVYESLLELTPQLNGGGRQFQFAEGGEAKGHARKTTGSYYTPDSLVQALLDSALEPVLDRVESEGLGSREWGVGNGTATKPHSPTPTPESEALLSVRVLDPACGSGHFLLAAARRIATRLAQARTQGLASPADYRHALRDVVRACIHGVDRNPMAVELTKVALWIETVEPGKPLGFLDANIRCGDSLLGVFDLKVLEAGIPDAAYKPLAGDDKAVARHYAQKNRREKAERERIAKGFGFNRQRDLMRDFAELRKMPEDTPEEIAAKAARLKALTAKGAAGWTLARACDLYVAAFLAPKVAHPQTAGAGGLPRRGAETVPTSGTVWELLRGVQPHGLLVQEAERALAGARPFHWPLEFPDVMAAGGFDVVLGNPPWERIKLQEQEFFAARDPEIAQAPNAAARGRLIGKLKEAEPATRERALYEEFEAAKRAAEASSVFARVEAEDGGRFPLTGRGDVNTYALFAELFASLTSKRGRAGVIVPTGIATDATTAPFFAALVSGKRLAQLIDFENRERLFPAVDSRMKFCLLTLGHDEKQSGFAFFLTDPRQLAEPERRFTLSAEDIARINPNTKTAPVFRSRADAELTAKIYARVPVLINEGMGSGDEGLEQGEGPHSLLPIPHSRGNPWGVSFMAMFHMSNDSGLFRTAAELAGAGFVREGSDWVRGNGVLGVGSGAPQSAATPQSPHPTPHRYVPLYEAKMIHQFDHRWATYAAMGSGQSGVGSGDSRSPFPTPHSPFPTPHSPLPITDSRDATLAEKCDPAFEPMPRYWVPEREVTERLAAKGWTRGWLMGWRDITNATNERTVIAAAFPRVGVGNKIPLILPDESISPRHMAALIGCLSSLALDFCARQKIGGTTLNFFILFQFPVLTPSTYTPAGLAFIVPRVLELTYTSWSMKPFADDIWRELGVGSREWVLRAWLRGHGKDDSILSGLDGLAGGHGAGGSLLSPNPGVPARGGLRADGPNTPGRSFHSSEHRGRLRPGEPEDLHAVSVRGTRLAEGDRDASAAGRTRGSGAAGIDGGAVGTLRPARPQDDILDPLPKDILTNPHSPLPIPPFRWDEDRRALLRAELDAWYARAYGLTRDELRYILDPAGVKGPDYPSETFRVLKQNEIRRFGEYRTARLVLAAWDKMEKGEW
jgi:hypothetical protein